MGSPASSTPGCQASSSTCSASIVNAAAAAASTIDAISATASSSTRWTESAPSNWSRSEVRCSGSPPGRDAGIEAFPYAARDFGARCSYAFARRSATR